MSENFIQKIRQKFSLLRLHCKNRTCIPITAYMKNNITISKATYGNAWNDLIKVHRRVLIPSPRLSNFTKRITRNKRKKLMEKPWKLLVNFDFRIFFSLSRTARMQALPNFRYCKGFLEELEGNRIIEFRMRRENLI